MSEPFFCPTPWVVAFHQQQKGNEMLSSLLKAGPCATSMTVAEVERSIVQACGGGRVGRLYWFPTEVEAEVFCANAREHHDEIGEKIDEFGRLNNAACLAGWWRLLPFVPS